MHVLSRTLRVAAVCAALAPCQAFAQAAATSGQATSAELKYPVSLENVRKGLEQPPPAFSGLLRMPDFYVRVEALVQPLDVGVFRPGKDFEPSVPFGIYAYEQMQASSPGGTAPIAGFNVMSVVQSIGGVISRANRARNQREAKETVRRAMEEFCAAQPDRGASVPGCVAPATP